MRIEHIAMYVNDLDAARDFLLDISMQNLTKVIIIKQRISVPIFYILMMELVWK